MGILLSKTMTPQAMRAYYETGGRISKIMEVTGKDYDTIVRCLKSAGAHLVTGGHGR